MILVDYSNVTFASIYIASKRVDTAQGAAIDEDFLRYLILNQIITWHKDYSKEFGEMVLCLDDHTDKCWRKDLFEYYKATRQEAREKQAITIDWKKIFGYLNEIELEFRQYLPYKMISIPKLEGDDIIASLCGLKADKELTMIISNDKDMKQLHRYLNVIQYFPQKKIKKRLNLEDIDLEIMELIVKGDKADGIPNIKSKSDSYVTHTRQTAVTSKYIGELYNQIIKQKKSIDECNITDFEKERYKENEKLIDLSKLPEEYKQKVIDVYNSTETNKNKNKMFEYMANKQIKTLLSEISSMF